MTKKRHTDSTALAAEAEAWDSGELTPSDWIDDPTALPLKSITRLRRGKIVEVPPEWVGKVTSRQQINKRPSKLPRKLRTRCGVGSDSKTHKLSSRHVEKRDAFQEYEYQDDE